jgi:hypothetical protein
VTAAQGGTAHDGATGALRAARRAALVITVMIAVGSFALSFAALRDLAARAGWPPQLAWMWPMIVDGAILMATVAIVALESSTRDPRGRRFFWGVLVCSAAVSIGGNGLHAILPRSAPLSPWLAAGIAVVPPAMLLAATHGLAVLIRLSGVPNRGDLPVAANDGAGEAVRSTECTRARSAPHWDSLAKLMAERGVAKGVGAPVVSRVLAASYERQLSNRAIGRELDLDARAVGRIVAVGAELLRSEGVAATSELDPAHRSAVSSTASR